MVDEREVHFYSKVLGVETGDFQLTCSRTVREKNVDIIALLTSTLLRNIQSDFAVQLQTVHSEHPSYLL